MVRIDPDPSYKPTSDRIPNLAAGGNHSALYFRRARPEASRPRGDASTKQKAQCGKQLIGPPPNPVASIDFPTPPLWHKEVLYDRQNGWIIAVLPAATTCFAVQQHFPRRRSGSTHLE